jgi:phosphoribosylformylglycinamidine synthase
MLKLFGPCPISDEENQQLLNNLRKNQKHIINLQVLRIYCIDIKGNLDADQQKRLMRLLKLKKWVEDLDKVSGHPVIMLPYKGIQSTWSSEITRIAFRCGLEEVRRIEHGLIYFLETDVGKALSQEELEKLHPVFSKDYSQEIFTDLFEVDRYFRMTSSKLPKVIDILNEGKAAIEAVNVKYSLALPEEDIEYVYQLYKAKGKNINSIELMTFAIVNSEECRHRLFTAKWKDKEGKEFSDTIFDLLRSTSEQYRDYVLSVFEDSASIYKREEVQDLILDSLQLTFNKKKQLWHNTFKTEYSHPLLGYVPKVAAGVMVGSEMRDQSAVACGARHVMGLLGMYTEDLKLPNFIRPWELSKGNISAVASALEIVTVAHQAAVNFNNVMGRPILCGFFRTLSVPSGEGEDGRQRIHGFHKPLMLTGGVGRIAESARIQEKHSAGMPIILLGGESMPVSVGGGNQSFTDFKPSYGDQMLMQQINASKQRSNQNLLIQCMSMAEHSPLRAVIEVGYGGLARAVTALVLQGKCGAYIQIANIPVAEDGMNPLEVWCNESQHRMLLVVEDKHLLNLVRFAERHYCQYSIIGHTLSERSIQVQGYHRKDQMLLDFSIPNLIEKLPPIQKIYSPRAREYSKLDVSGIQIDEAARRILQLPCVSDKTPFITIADRTVGGLTARDPMVGPWQIPVADVGVACQGFYTHKGTAMAIGERAPLAAIDPELGVQMALGEALTNLMAAPVLDIEKIQIAVNWSGTSGNSDQENDLYGCVRILALDLCKKLKLVVTAGDESFRSEGRWDHEDVAYGACIPMSAVIVASAPVEDVNLTKTPVINSAYMKQSRLIFVDLSYQEAYMGGSALSQVYSQLGSKAPRFTGVERLQGFLKAMSQLHSEGRILAYHDRSDGGLLVTLSEMAFASHVGLDITLDGIADSGLRALFHEGLGVVLQVEDIHLSKVNDIFRAEGIERVFNIGACTEDDNLVFRYQGQVILRDRRQDWHRIWFLTASRIKMLRDNSECAKESYNGLLNTQDPGLNAKLTFQIEADRVEPLINEYGRPRVAILCAAGSTGHTEMAHAFEQAGFCPVELTLSDLETGHETLDAMVGLALCTGHAYNDVFGSGFGISQIIINNTKTREQFEKFFKRQNVFTIGVGEGGHVLSLLRDMIPGTTHWPRLEQNRSEQMESRLTLVQIESTESIMLKGMAGSLIPVPIAGRYCKMNFKDNQGVEKYAALRFVNNFGNYADYYPANPSGSEFSAAAVTSLDGRVLLSMVHPERVTRTSQFSWHPSDWPEVSPWLRMFQNLRDWTGSQRR